MNLRLLLVALTLPLLALLYWLLKPDPVLPDVRTTASVAASPQTSAPTATRVVSSAPVKTAEEPALTLEWRIAHGHVVEAPSHFVVQQGGTVHLSVTSDEPDTLHIHGYDLTAKVTPEASTEVSLLAQHSGRFEIELHHSGLELGALEVLPH